MICGEGKKEMIKFESDTVHCKHADVAEWLRRLTRNQFPFGSVGSNPTICVQFLIEFRRLQIY